MHDIAWRDNCCSLRNLLRTWNPKIHCCLHKSLSADTFLKKSKQVVSLHSIFLKSNTVPVHAMKTHKETRGIALLIVNLGTRWMLDLISRLGRFTPGKGPQYPLNKGLILIFLFPHTSWLLLSLCVIRMIIQRIIWWAGQVTRTRRGNKCTQRVGFKTGEKKSSGKMRPMWKSFMFFRAGTTGGLLRIS